MSYWPKYKLMNLRKILTPKGTDKASNMYHKIFSTLIEPYEAPSPKVITSYPGPKTQDHLQSFSNVLFNRNKELIDADKSFGNYFTDMDGNVVLDMEMDNGRNLLGYNSRRLLRETEFQKYTKYLIQRPAMGMFPPQEYPKMLANLVSRFSPPGVSDVYFTCGCTSSANDNAIKIAYLHKFFQVKGSDKITPEEEKSVFQGSLPGAPNFAVIGFEGGSHGASLTDLSVSSCEHTNLNLVNRFKWPTAPFPKIKYPYEEHEAENRREEERCVALTEELIKNTFKEKPIAAMIIEPIQKGVRYASSQFYKNLLDLCYQYGITFICDETLTSGWVDGRPFIHQRWQAEKPVHMVTFGNRMQFAGILYQNQFRPRYAFQIHSTWNGDAVKLLQVSDIIDQLGKEWMDNHGATFWQGIRGELQDLQSKWNVPISNIRGIGKIFAFDLEHSKIRDEVHEASRQSGFKIGKAGSNSLVFTPSLMFTEVHFAKYKQWLLKYQPRTHSLGAFSK
jgi:4-aminobutyrate aminotransferase/(S)-3-amino-2-methylpropionate transaminase